MQAELKVIDGQRVTLFTVKNKEYKKLSDKTKQILGVPVKKRLFYKIFKCIGDYLNDEELSSALK